MIQRIRCELDACQLDFTIQPATVDGASKLVLTESHRPDVCIVADNHVMLYGGFFMILLGIENPIAEGGSA